MYLPAHLTYFRRRAVLLVPAVIPAVVLRGVEPVVIISSLSIVDVALLPDKLRWYTLIDLVFDCVGFLFDALEIKLSGLLLAFIKDIEATLHSAAQLLESASFLDVIAP